MLLILFLRMGIQVAGEDLPCGKSLNVVVRTAWLYGYVGKNSVAAMEALGTKYQRLALLIRWVIRKRKLFSSRNLCALRLRKLSSTIQLIEHIGGILLKLL